ncbi:MAG TPA: Mpo1-like protein, partial [Vicinamibacterales bacterium]
MVDRYFAEYASYHTDRRNLICHEIGIPLIVWSLFSLLHLVRLGPIDLAMVLGVLVIIFYLRLDAKLG